MKIMKKNNFKKIINYKQIKIKNNTGCSTIVAQFQFALIFYFLMK